MLRRDVFAVKVGGTTAWMTRDRAEAVRRAVWERDVNARAGYAMDVRVVHPGSREVEQYEAMEGKL